MPEACLAGLQPGLGNALQAWSVSGTLSHRMFLSFGRPGRSVGCVQAGQPPRPTAAMRGARVPGTG